ncbi:MAG: 30S ribosomal protein S13 [Planctomycetota bacterium]|nr:MAG: 30S ribosomal protein S13 [Planctomycetota bacterium]
MPRIAGVDIPAQKPVVVALTYIYGIGRASAGRILAEAGIRPAVRARDLSESELASLNSIIEKRYTVEGQLRRSISQDIQRLKDINSWRGLRHRKGLPVRGQRTRTNARTRKGPRKTVAGKKGIKEMGG